MSSARMAESADATDLKSVIHWVYGFKSRSGYHYRKNYIKTKIGFANKFAADFLFFIHIFP